MTTKQIDEEAWEAHPFTWPNNRGQGILKNKGRETYIRYGFPPPPPKRKNKKASEQKKDDLKGGDRIGWTEVIITPDMVGKKIAVFTNIEIKGPGDTLKPGQKKFHNMILSHYGISEIWHEDKIIKDYRSDGLKAVAKSISATEKDKCLAIDFTA